MKKYIIFLLAVTIMLLPVYVFAQGVGRNASGTSVQTQPARSNFTSLAAIGQDVGGNPGYLVLTGAVVAGNDSYLPEWYFWVDSASDLCMASHPNIANEAAFPDGDWNDFGSGACTKVGGQT